MMELDNVKNRMARDTLMYLPAKALEGVAGILTITFYSRFFAEKVFGSYGLVTTTINIACVFLLGWLVQSGFRYVNTFESPNKMKLFYSTVFTVWLSINGIVLLLALTALFFVRPLLNAQMAGFYLAGIFMFVTYNTTQMLFSILSATRRIRLNLLLSVFSASSKLILTTVFILWVKISAATAVSAIMSSIFIDAFVIAVIVLRLHLFRHINLCLFSENVLKKFLNYGVPIMGVSLTMSLLNISDRYVIAFLLGPDKGPGQVGVYIANYSIASSVFNIILVTVMRGVYPVILKTWRQNDREQAEFLLSQAVRYFMLITAPAVVGMCVLSGAISRIFLAPGYYDGGFVITCVAVGMLFLGLTEYSNKAWELTARTKTILRNSLLGGCFNLVSNVAFIPVFGYRAAAVNTALSYLLYLILSLTGSRRIYKWHLPLSSYFRIAGSSAVMGGLLFAAVVYKPPSVVVLLILILSGGATYAVCLYFTGEVANEVRQAKLWLQRHKGGL